MIGSLNKIWPWRNPTRWLDKETYEVVNVSDVSFIEYADKEIKILTESNVLPSAYHGSANTILVLVAMVLGLLIIYGLAKFDKEGDK